MLALHCAGHPQDEWASPALLTAQPNRKIGVLGQRVRSTLLWGRAYSVVEPDKRHTRTPARQLALATQSDQLLRYTSSALLLVSPFTRTDGGPPGVPTRGEVHDPLQRLCPWQSHRPSMDGPASLACGRLALMRRRGGCLWSGRGGRPT
jgi:hypothetical protein